MRFFSDDKSVIDVLIMNKATAVLIAVIGLAFNVSASQRPVSGDGISGRWESTQTTARGELKVTLDLKSEGQTLRGAVTGPTGQQQEIQNGKIDRGSISFETNVLINGEQFTISWTGTLSDDVLKLTRSIIGHEQFQFAPIQAKRASQHRM